MEQSRYPPKYSKPRKKNKITMCSILQLRGLIAPSRGPFTAHSGNGQHFTVWLFACGAAKAIAHSLLLPSVHDLSGLQTDLPAFPFQFARAPRAVTALSCLIPKSHLSSCRLRATLGPKCNPETQHPALNSQHNENRRMEQPLEPQYPWEPAALPPRPELN
mmetsp:Transcript_24347/g.38276  ORF Transcript_24347/g.38276 Transcript_24347/m.38276 type:complete len:161 (+) Transcript_24347:98-580(+)